MEQAKLHLLTILRSTSVLPTPRVALSKIGTVVDRMGNGKRLEDRLSAYQSIIFIIRALFAMLVVDIRCSGTVEDDRREVSEV